MLSILLGEHDISKPRLNHQKEPWNRNNIQQKCHPSYLQIHVPKQLEQKRGHHLSRKMPDLNLNNNGHSVFN